MKKIILITVILFINNFAMHAQNNDRVADSASEVCPLKIGMKVPSAKFKDAEGRVADIKDLLQNSKTVLIFYRGGWCPYCNLHLSELKAIEDDLMKLGYKLIAVSIDKPEKLKESFSKHKLNYDLYSDSKAEVSRSFGIAFKVDDEYIEKLKSHDMDLEESSGETHHILPVPSVFIVDEEGTIQFQYVNVDYKIRMKPSLILEAAKSL